MLQLFVLSSLLKASNLLCFIFNFSTNQCCTLSKKLHMSTVSNGGAISLTVLQSIATDALSKPLTQDQLKSLLSSLRCDTDQTYSYALAALSQALAGSQKASNVRTLGRRMIECFSGTNSSEVLEGLDAFNAVMKVQPDTGIELLGHDELRMAMVDIFEHVQHPITDVGSHEKPQLWEEQTVLAESLSLLAGQSPTRGMVRSLAGRWLESIVLPTKPTDFSNMRQQSFALVAIVKLKVGTESKEDSIAFAYPCTKASFEGCTTMQELATLAVALFIKAQDTVQGLHDARATAISSLEALAYLTLGEPAGVKDEVCTFTFLSAILSCAMYEETSPQGATILFSIASLLVNITAYPKLENKSDSVHLARLKAFAAAGQGSLPRIEAVENVAQRVRLIGTFTPSPLVVARKMCSSPSIAVRRLAGHLLLNLVTPIENRGKLLQGGLGKLLLILARQIPMPFEVQKDSAVVQALAKILITTNPALIFGPTSSSPGLLEAASVLCHLLAVGDDVGLLEQFECLMALTNIASLSEALTDELAALSFQKSARVPDGKALLSVLQEYLLNSNVLVCRAATELICNLVGSSNGTAFYSKTQSIPASHGNVSNVSPRLQILVALSSAQDTPTQLAAAGALATLASCTPIGCSLLLDRKSMTILLSLLTDHQDPGDQSDQGLRHRGYEVFRSMFQCVTADFEEEVAKVVDDITLINILKEVLIREPIPSLKEIGQEALISAKHLKNKQE